MNGWLKGALALGGGAVGVELLRRTAAAWGQAQV